MKGWDMVDIIEAGGFSSHEPTEEEKAAKVKEAEVCKNYREAKKKALFEADNLLCLRDIEARLIKELSEVQEKISQLVIKKEPDPKPFCLLEID